MKNHITFHKYTPTLISMFDVALSAILIFATMNMQLGGSVFVHFAISLGISAALFFMSYIALLNIAISAIYSFLWTYLIFYITQAIPPLKSLYSSEWKSLLLGGIFIAFDYLHLISHYHHNDMERKGMLEALFNSNYNLQQENKELKTCHIDRQEQEETLSQLIRDRDNLLRKNGALENELSTLQEKLDSLTPKKFPRSSLTDYEKGKKCRPKDNFYDSPGEERLDDILHFLINKKYQFGKNFGLRVLVLQPLSNYTKALNQDEKSSWSGMNKKVNNKNRWTHFDFMIETRKNHCPLLAIELDGPSHSREEQKKRDEYKNGACDALNIPLIRIPYDGEGASISNEFIESNYEEEIVQKLISSLKNQARISKEDLLKKYSGDTPRDKMIQKYA